MRVDVYPTNAKGEPITDLTADDFEVLEDNKPQKVTQFERVALSTTTAREERRDPVSADDGRRQAADPRRRVYVIFLDTWHTDFAGAVRARKPLVNMLERLIGPDDLFAVMTPDMDPRQITFARRTETIDDMLMKQTQWGMKDSIIRQHPEEQQLEMCFPEGMPPPGCAGSASRNANKGIAAQLIRRRRENEVLDALEGLVRYLGGVREERKALITVTTGYQMFEPKEDLLRHEECAAPPSMGRHGHRARRPDHDQHGPRPERARGAMSSIECATTAAKYARLNNRQRFIALTQEANRYNVSFYPFDTRGLAAFDSNVGDRDERMVADRGEWYNKESGTQPGTMMGDRASLNVRLDSLRLLADNTDGLAIINTNNLDAGAARIVQDLSSYYLLGYYSANESLDGKWRTIKVRVEAAWRAGARAQGLSRAARGGHGRHQRDGEEPRRAAVPARRRPRRKADCWRRHSVRSAAFARDSHGAAAPPTSSTPAPARPRAPVGCGSRPISIRQRCVTRRSPRAARWP